MVKVLNCLVCDDVRQEVTGKFILIGVYGSDLNVLNPATANKGIMLNLWMEIEAETVESPKVQLRAIVETGGGESENIAFELELGLNTVSSPEDTQTLAVQFQCRVDFSHSLRFELKADPGEWQFARRIRIRAPLSSSNMPPSGALAVN